MNWLLLVSLLSQPVTPPSVQNVFPLPVYFSDGTAAAPSITFIADTNTGVYRVGSDIIGFTNGGTRTVEFAVAGQTMCGTGATSNECLTWTYGATGNQVDVSSATGASLLDFGTINLATNALDVSDGSITNVTDIQLDSLTADATSGGITIGGQGATSTESIKWQFGETANTVNVSSTTGVTSVDYGSIKLECGSADLSSGDLTNIDDIYQSAITTDAAPNVTVIGTQPVFATPGATNKTGANLVLAPSPGARTLTGVTKAGVCATCAPGGAASNITVQAYANGVAITPACIKTAGDGTLGTFLCDGAADDNTCVANLYAAYVATPCTGVTVTYTAGTETLTWSITPGSAEYLTVTPNDGTDMVVVSSSDGKTQLSPLFTVEPIISSNALAGFQLKYNGVDAGYYAGSHWYFPNNINFYTGLAAAAGSFGFYNRTTLLAPAEARLTISSSTISKGNFEINTSAFTKGQTTIFNHAANSVTFAATPGDASKTITGLVPLGATLLSITGRVVTPSSAECTTCKVGLDMGAGLDDDMIGSAIECDVNDTLITTATATANWVGGCLKAGGCDLTVTAVGGAGTCANAVLAFTATYLTATAATTD